MLSLNLYCVFIYLCVNSDAASGPVVDTSVGKISGITGIGFNAYLGIPYGVVDEENPYDAATPASLFSDTYLAHEDPVICPQIVKGIPQGSIHCLNLNIYTPNDATSDSSLPVMVFIHGGGFVEGDSNLKTYSPKYLVRKNVIVVTFNYRLGPYGFLCLPKTNYSNQGLKDQALAFDWVKRNIHFFGGNNEDMTLFGHSAGSGSAELHLLFNEKIVFNKVILQSGFVVSPFMLEKAANEKYIREVAGKFDLDATNIKIDDILKELFKTDVTKLIDVMGNDIFRPCVDGVFITKTPNVDLRGIKVILGTAMKEMLFFHKNDYSASQFFVYLPEQSIGMVKDYYSGTSKDDTIDFETDFIFNYPVERAARFYEANADAVYRYVFAYDGGRNFIKLRDNIKSEGATHGDELGYLFDADFLGDKITAADQAVIDAMTDWWTNFAKYGNPESSWPAVDKISKSYKKIGLEITTEKDFFKDKIDFWDKLYSMYGGCMRGVDFGEEYKCMENNSNIFGMSFIISIIIGVLLLKCFNV